MNFAAAFLYALTPLGFLVYNNGIEPMGGTIHERKTER